MKHGRFIFVDLWDYVWVSPTPEGQVGVGSIRNSVKTKMNIMEVRNKMRSHIHCGDPGSNMYN